MDVTTFRQDFPEFADTTVYPASTINFWLGIGVLMLRPTQWQTLLDQGLALFTAHHVAIATGNLKGKPGQAYTPMTSKSIERLAASYDPNVGITPEMGHWALTTYGRMFWYLKNMAGMGATQVGNGPSACGPILLEWYG